MAARALAGSSIYIGVGTAAVAFNPSAAAAVNTTTNNLTIANAGVVNTIDYPDSIAMFESTAFGDTAVSRQPGLPDVGDIALNIKNTLAMWAAILVGGSSWRGLTAAGQTVRVVVAPNGLANGSPYWYVEAWYGGTGRSSNPNDPQALDVTLSSTGPVTFGSWTA